MDHAAFFTLLMAGFMVFLHTSYNWNSRMRIKFQNERLCLEPDHASSRIKTTRSIPHKKQCVDNDGVTTTLPTFTLQLPSLLLHPAPLSICWSESLRHDGRQLGRDKVATHVKPTLASQKSSYMNNATTRKSRLRKRKSIEQSQPSSYSWRPWCW